MARAARQVRGRAGVCRRDGGLQAGRGSLAGLGAARTVVKKLLTLLYFAAKTLVLMPPTRETSPRVVFLPQHPSPEVTASPFLCSAWGAVLSVGCVRRWTSARGVEGAGGWG